MSCSPAMGQRFISHPPAVGVMVARPVLAATQARPVESTLTSRIWLSASVPSSVGQDSAYRSDTVVPTGQPATEEADPQAFRVLAQRHG